jgi:ribosomal protein S27E
MTNDKPQMSVDRLERKCFLCGSNADSFFDSPAHVNLYITCKTCGNYIVNPSFWRDLREDQKAMLSAYCRRNPGNWVSIDHEEVEKLSALVPRYNPPEKIDRLLQILGERSTKLGKPASFNVMTDYPLIVANGWQEAQFLIGTLIQKKFVDTYAVLSGPQYTVTMDGWNRIEELKTSGRSLTQCFVAMAFRKDTDDIWGKVIEPAIKDAGYKPYRIDREHHVNRIDDEIIAQIRRSRFMVADFTLQRGGVYFESGMMHGLGRNVIWMCHESELAPEKGLHFDIRQYNFLTYNDPDEAIKKQLYDRILAIEGEGPLLTSETEP